MKQLYFVTVDGRIDPIAVVARNLAQAISAVPNPSDILKIEFVQTHDVVVAVA